MGTATKRSRKQQREEEEEEDFYGREDGFCEDESNSESDMEEEEEEGDEDGEEESDVAGQNDGSRGGGEMEELEREYLSLRNEQQSLLKDLKRQKDEDLLKGQAVKNQKALWDKSLEFRFLLQKAFSNSNRLPQEPIRTSFCDSNIAVKEAYAELISSSSQTLNCLSELQEVILEKNPSFACTTEDPSNNVDDEDDEEWIRIHKTQNRIAAFRNSAVDKWHRKTQVTTGAAAFKGKLHAFNQNISEQVASHMRDPSRMVKRMQLRRSAVGILGHVLEASGTKTEEDGDIDGDPELIDDSEFYQQLLKEFFESCDVTSSETAFYALKRLQTKKRKIVDRRASKSRKIRYNVHEKIVNFMAPKPVNLPQMAPMLFSNLFGL